MQTGSDGKEFQVSFLRKSEKMTGKFIFPTTKDVASVPLDSIVQVLPKSRPTEQGLTKRQKSYFSFGINFDSIDIR